MIEFEKIKQFDMLTIREAVLKNVGGMDAATDGQILLIWNALEPQTQEKYLESVKKHEGKKLTPNIEH